MGWRRVEVEILFWASYGGSQGIHLLPFHELLRGRRRPSPIPWRRRIGFIIYPFRKLIFTKGKDGSSPPLLSLLPSNFINATSLRISHHQPPPATSLTNCTKKCCFCQNRITLVLLPPPHPAETSIKAYNCTRATSPNPPLSIPCGLWVLWKANH